MIDNIKTHKTSNGMKKTFLLLTIYFLFTAIPISIQGATDYTLLAPIPLTGTDSTPSPKTTAKPYIEGVFKLIIAIAGGLAVVMIIFGGIKYMSTDAIGGKSEARGTIENAIWGLLLVIGAWLILFTINPKLVEFDLSIEPTKEVSNTNTPASKVPDVAGCLPPCVTISVPHKEAPQGCAAPGPCQLNLDLDAKLVKLNRLDGLSVNEGYPPSNIVDHTAPCHSNGTCADVSSNDIMTPANALKMVNDGSGLGLKVLVEVANANRLKAMVDGGVPSSQVIVTKGNGEHYHIVLVR